MTAAIKADVEKAVVTLAAIAKAPAYGFGDSYKTVGVNISLAACDAAHEITGVSRTFCRMLNHKFRTDAVAMMFASACRQNKIR